MRDTFPFFDILVIPLDAGVTDARIEIDGILGEIRVYDATGTLVGKWSSTDFLVKHPTNGSQVKIVPGTGVNATTSIFLYADEISGYDPASISALSDLASTPVIHMHSPNITGEDDSVLSLYGENSASGIRPAFVIDVRNGEFALLQSTDTGIIGGGYRRDSFSTSSSAMVSAETVVRTIPNMIFRDNRAYKASFGYKSAGDAANTQAIYRVRKTNATGTLYGDGGRFYLTNTSDTYWTQGHWYLRRNNGAGDLTTDVVLTLQTSSGGNASHQADGFLPRHLLIEDVGSASQYQFALSVT